MTTQCANIRPSSPDFRVEIVHQGRENLRHTFGSEQERSAWLRLWLERNPTVYEVVLSQKSPPTPLF